MTEEKILLQEYIRIKNNQVEISEGLRGNKSIKVVEDKDIISIELLDFSHTFNIPDGVDIENELVARVSGFTEFDDERFLNEALAKSEQAPMFDLSPNPNNGRFAIGVNSPSSNESVQVKLFDAQGSYVRTLFNGILNNENGQIEIETGGLANGIYFITIVGNGIIETKKLIITQ